MDKSSPTQLSRRAFLQVTASAAGGFVLATSYTGSGSAAVAGAFVPNAFIRIEPSGQVVLVMMKAEMGQGISTALAQLIAEELEVDASSVRLEEAPADDSRYGEPLFGGLQMTGGSTSIRGAWRPMREAGACARMMLKEAAARRWNVSADQLTARNGAVTHLASGRKASYGELATEAAQLPVPKVITLKDPKDFRQVGKGLKRLDSRIKVDGSAVFGMDVKRPGMLYASVQASPVLGGKLSKVDEQAALKTPGVVQVVQLTAAVAVVARNTWAARQGLTAAAPSWSDGPNTAVGTADMIAALDAAVQAPGAVAAKVGDVSAPKSAGGKSHDARYHAPFLAHATMEPMNCTVDVGPGVAQVWVGTQVPTRARAVVAAALGLRPEAVTINNQLLGGGFGRRLEVDFIAQAAEIAKHVRAPVKVVWSREEDMQQDMYRPYYVDQLNAVTDSKGAVQAWKHRVAASSIIARFLPPAFKDGVDRDAVEGAVETPYAFPSQLVEYTRVEPAALRTAFWRGVGPTHNGFVVEGFVDELAAAAGVDPVEYRLGMTKDPRARNVLELAAKQSAWGSPLPTGQGRGVALMHAFGTYVAQVSLVEVDKEGELKVLKVDCVVDCGFAINPSTVAAQMEGGIVFGLGAVLWQDITVAAGRVEQSNFHDYRVVRMNEAPAIHVHIVPSAEAPGGVGEPGTSAAIPSVVNAAFAATGKRIRTLPIGSQLKAS
ncbi:molybdopterin cofactor-binding domain-containing protein [Roseateles sp. So40a]|uniref:xanthine dehydrogenase family protein molybdopterin-binding subunit n=1 Tax=Roseateles sp. So40a TaxID=3400226 RepID=UPI003A847156